MAAVGTTAPPIVKDFRDLRQPHIQIARLEMHGAVFNRRAVCNEADLWKGCHKIGFQADNLETIGGDPGAFLERDGVDRTLRSDLVGANAVRLVCSLAEIDLPRRSCFGTSQAFTSHLKIWRVVRMKDEH